MGQPQQARTSAPAWSVQDLLRPEAFPHETTALSLRETHISWVILTGPYAYKIKKPVKLDFLDASTLEQRHRYCKEELRLNQRLAPDLYLEVVFITCENGRPSIGGDGPIVEYAVRMRQFPAENELPTLLAKSEVSAAEIGTLGESLAAFHRDAAISPAANAPERTERMYETVMGNLAELAAHLGPTAPSLSLAPVVAWTLENARKLRHEFEQRERSGFVRECHGDLHAANIVRSEGRLVPFDCIEFDPDLRWIDVMNDVAFLVMDLASHQRTDLAYILLNRYLERTGDYASVGLLPFYAVYRALVRAKVDALTAQQVPARSAEFRHRLQQRIRAATTWTTLGQPVLVLMHGASGSGKSWLSERLVPELRAVRVRADLERKRLAEIQPTQSAASAIHKGIYSPEFSHRTYGRLTDCAEHCLQAGISTIVDASFLEQTDRELLCNLAARMRTPWVIVSCQADPIALAARILDRAHLGSDASDANLAVLDAQLRSSQPFQESEERHVIAVDTSDPDAMQRVVAAIATKYPR